MSALLLGWFGIGFCALYPGEGVILPGAGMEMQALNGSITTLCIRHWIQAEYRV